MPPLLTFDGGSTVQKELQNTLAFAAMNHSAFNKSMTKLQQRELMTDLVHGGPDHDASYAEQLVHGVSMFLECCWESAQRYSFRIAGHQGCSLHHTSIW